jgi:chemotaxis protein methyltransferase CheR
MAAAVVHPLDQADLTALGQVCGIPLAAYRPGHVRACVGRMLARCGVPDLPGLIQLCRRDALARAAMLRCLLVPTTGLFRDPEQFALLEQELLPGLAGGAPRGLRVWSAGCSDGTELYSVALILSRLGVLPQCQLVGTDILAERVDRASRGGPATGPARRAAGAVLRWQRRDLVRDPPPPGRFDLVLCRNVLIYLDTSVRSTVYRKLAGVLRRGGVLLLGRSEWLAEPAPLGLVPAGPHAYRKEAACEPT